MSHTNGVDKAEPRKLKILMLHGYTQSGPLFHAKTRALEKSLHRAFPASTPKSSLSPLHTTYPGGIALSYPTAPIRLLPADIPGFSPAASEDSKEASDAWGWWKRDADGTYIGLSQGLETIANSILEMGGIDAVIGFSQGAGAAGILAALLEPGRTPPAGFELPSNWEEAAALQPKGLKFAVSYCGFRAPGEAYNWIYKPKIQCPVLNVIGSLDSVVDEGRSLALVEACENQRTVYHPGGHFVPVGKEMAAVLVGWIRECCEEEKEEEVGVEDMDVPF